MVTSRSSGDEDQIPNLKIPGVIRKHNSKFHMGVHSNRRIFHPEGYSGFISKFPAHPDHHGWKGYLFPTTWMEGALCTHAPYNLKEQRYRIVVREETPPTQQISPSAPRFSDVVSLSRLRRKSIVDLMKGGSSISRWNHRRGRRTKLNTKATQYRIYHVFDESTPAGPLDKSRFVPPYVKFIHHRRKPHKLHRVKAREA